MAHLADIVVINHLFYAVPARVTVSPLLLSQPA